LPTAVTQNDRIGLHFTPAAVTAGVQLLVESSNALGPWQPRASRLPGTESWMIDTPGSEASPGPAAGEIVILSPVSDQPRFFLRLRAVAE